MTTPASSFPPSIPTLIVVGPKRYRVVVDANAIAVAGQRERAGLDGHCDYAAQVITIEPNLGPDSMAEVLLHEVIHAVLEQASSGLNADQQEAAAHALGNGLLDVLRRNPALTAYLVAEVEAA